MKTDAYLRFVTGACFVAAAAGFTNRLENRLTGTGDSLFSRFDNRCEFPSITDFNRPIRSLVVFMRNNRHESYLKPVPEYAK